ncbi:MAG: hypothetical protein WC607_00145 [Candidatus Micrarchaeia archaeon]
MRFRFIALLALALAGFACATAAEEDYAWHEELAQGASQAATVFYGEEITLELINATPTMPYPRWVLDFHTETGVEIQQLRVFNMRDEASGTAFSIEREVNGILITYQPNQPSGANKVYEFQFACSRGTREYYIYGKSDWFTPENFTAYLTALTQACVDFEAIEPEPSVEPTVEPTVLPSPSIEPSAEPTVEPSIIPSPTPVASVAASPKPSLKASPAPVEEDDAGIVLWAGLVILAGAAGVIYYSRKE